MRFNRRSLCTSALTLVLATSPAISTAAQTNQVEVSKVNVSKIRIDNFGRINTNYYRSAQPEGRDYADLAALGIKTVIDFQGDGDNYDEAERVQRAGMRFYRFPMTTHVPPTPDQLASFMRMVNDPAQQPVYVHCKGGKHRTGVITAVYRMENDGWTAAQAFREMKQYEFGWDLLHPEFKKFVYAYDVQPDRSAPIQTVAATN